MGDRMAHSIPWLLLLLLPQLLCATDGGQPQPEEAIVAQDDSAQVGGNETVPPPVAVELPFVTAEEEDLAKRLKDSEAEYCSHPFKGDVNEEEAKKLLKSGATNSLKAHMLEALKDTDPEKGFMERSVDYAAEVGQRAEFVAPVCLAGLLVAAWPILCCHVSCQRCRCRSKKRVPPGWFKVLIWAVLISLCALVSYYGIFAAIVSTGSVQLGAENFLCSSKELASVSLSGHLTEPEFPGTIEVLSRMEYLAKSFDENSDFLNGMDKVLEHATDIYKSSLVVLGTVKLLDSLHGSLTSAECQLCDEMDVLRPHAESAVRDSAGFKLGQLRKNPPKPTDAQKEEIRSQIGIAAAPMIKLKNSMTEWAEEFVREGNFNKMQEFLVMFCKALLVVSCISIGSALVLVLCGCTSAAKFVCFETAQRKEDEANSPEGSPLVENEAEAADTPKEFNPYNPTVYKWASRTWCWGLCYSIVTLIASATMSYAMVPITETCLLLGDLLEDSSLIPDIQSSAGEGAAQLQAIFDGCILNASGKPAYLIDILGVNEEAGVKQNLARSVNATAYDVFGDLLTNANAAQANVLQTQAIRSIMEVFERDAQTLTSQLANTQYNCAVFEWLDRDMPECDTKDRTIVQSGGCLSGYQSDDIESMMMKRVDKPCPRDEYVVYLQEFQMRLALTLIEFDQIVGEKRFAIKEEFEKAFQENIVDFIKELGMDTDCRYLGVYYKEMLAGMCYQSLTGINKIHDAYMFSGYCTIALVIIMFLLWRVAKDNFDHFNDMEREDYEKIRKDEEAERAEADRTNPFVSSESEFKAPDPSIIPESVRRAQQEAEARSSE